MASQQASRRRFLGKPVADNEWYSRDECIRRLNQARFGYAGRALRSGRILQVRDKKGKIGYYGPSVENEVEWIKKARPQDLAWRRVTDRYHKIFGGYTWNGTPGGP